MIEKRRAMKQPSRGGEGGFSLILWKQQGLLCALVSDLVSEDDLARLKQYYVKVRSSTEPAPTS